MEHVGKVTANLRAIPAEKRPNVILRTVIGLLFVLLGAGLIGVMVRVMLVTQKLEPNLWMLGSGLVAIVIGATTWSTQIVSAPFKFALALLRDVFDIVRGRTQPPPP